MKNYRKAVKERWYENDLGTVLSIVVGKFVFQGFKLKWLQILEII